MKSTLRLLRGSVVLGVTLALSTFALMGCEPRKPAASTPPPSAAQSEGLTRDAAILHAQRDAAFRYSEVQVARAEAYRQGGFWVVELTSQSGSGLRYTISAQDGSIRQRNMFQ
ncbi:MAG: hypothetical protein R3B70_16715 [Polyangiaceae bacterium]